jgi:hypothetical protein
MELELVSKQRVSKMLNESQIEVGKKFRAELSNSGETIVEVTQENETHWFVDLGGVGLGVAKGTLAELLNSHRAEEISCETASLPQIAEVSPGLIFKEDLAINVCSEIRTR